MPRHRYHQWTRYELDTMLALVSKSAHLIQFDHKDGKYKKKKDMNDDTYMNFATQLNFALHGKDYAMDIDHEEVIRKLDELMKDRSHVIGKGSLWERSKARHITRTLKATWRRTYGLNYKGTKEEWEWKKGKTEEQKRMGMPEGPNARAAVMPPPPRQFNMTASRYPTQDDLQCPLRQHPAQQNDFSIPSNLTPFDRLTEAFNPSSEYANAAPTPNYPPANLAPTPNPYQYAQPAAANTGYTIRKQKRPGLARRAVARGQDNAPHASQVHLFDPSFMKRNIPNPLGHTPVATPMNFNMGATPSYRAPGYGTPAHQLEEEEQAAMFNAAFNFGSDSGAGVGGGDSRGNGMVDKAWELNGDDDDEENYGGFGGYVGGDGSGQVRDEDMEEGRELMEDIWGERSGHERDDRY